MLLWVAPGDAKHSGKDYHSDRKLELVDIPFQAFVGEGWQ
jgi:hypothetical protein